MAPTRPMSGVLVCLLGLALSGLAGGCNNQAGSIDVQKAPPIGIQDETRPLKPAPTKAP